VGAARADEQIDGLGEARDLLRRNVLGPDAVRDVFGVSLPDVLTAEERRRISRLPFDRPTLERAAANDAVLVLRVPRDRHGTLSIRRLHERFPEAFTAKGVTDGVGYQLRSEWTAMGLPFADQPPELGWRLVSAEPPADTRGRSYAQQEAAPAAWAARLGLDAARGRRRSAVDAVYDLVLAFGAGQRRLLEGTWDWTRTETPDGAFVTVGSFGSGGLQILAYSAAVRFGSLGVCPEAA
jgi:hypothetical protein